MNYNIYIPVSQKHIDAGTRKSCSCCPIALAINDCLNPAFIAKVGIESCIELYDQWNREICQYAFSLQSEVAKFIHDFDYLYDVKPFTFLLPGVPERMIRGL